MTLSEAIPADTNAYRVVWNSRLGEVVILAASPFGSDGILNNSAGKILDRLSTEPENCAQIIKQFPEFFSTLQTHHLIGPLGDMRASFRAFRGKEQLKSIQIELTRVCNLRCSYCYSESGPWQKGSGLPLEQVYRVLKEAEELGCITVDFTGGEPLAYRWWKEVLTEARRLGLVTTLHTNGTLLTEPTVEFLAKLPLRHLQVSLDSHLPEVHDRIRGMPGAWEKAVAGIKIAQRLGIFVRVAIVAHKENRDHFREAVSFFNESLGVSTKMDRIIKTGGEKTANLGISTKEYYELIAPLTAKGAVDARVCESSVRTHRERIEPACGVAHSFLYITAEGEIALCPTMTSRDDPRFGSPRLADVGIREAWERSPYIESYRFLNCRNVDSCPTGAACGGGCRSNAYFETGELDSPDQLHCNLNKNGELQFKDFLGEYAKAQSELVSIKPRSIKPRSVAARTS